MVEILLIRQETLVLINQPINQSINLKLSDMYLHLFDKTSRITEYTYTDNFKLPETARKDFEDYGYILIR